MSVTSGEATTYSPPVPILTDETWSHAETLFGALEPFAAQTSSEPILIHELAEYDQDAQGSIRRGLTQEGTIDRGSFGKFIE